MSGLVRAVAEGLYRGKNPRGILRVPCPPPLQNGQGLPGERDMKRSAVLGVGNGDGLSLQIDLIPAQAGCFLAPQPMV